MVEFVDHKKNHVIHYPVLYDHSFVGILKAELLSVDQVKRVYANTDISEI